MKVKDYKNEAFKFTSKASDAARQLAFAGIATAWLFYTARSDAKSTPPAGLLTTLLSFAIALGIDAAHYVLAGVIWITHFYVNTVWLRKSEDTECNHSVFWPVVIHFAYFAKIGFVILGYIYLIGFIRTQF